jgi:hypothetical protein
MIGREEIREAFLKVQAMMEENDPPWSKFMEKEGIDPNVVLEVCDEHKRTMESFGMDELDISFGAGFTLAVVVLSLRREAE